MKDSKVAPTNAMLSGKSSRRKKALFQATKFRLRINHRQALVEQVQPGLKQLVPVVDLLGIGGKV